MTDLRTSFPAQNVIPVPQRIDDAAERAAWATQTAETFCTAVRPVSDAAVRLTAALDDLARICDGDTATFLIVSGDGAVLAPLIVSRTAGPMSRDELAAFLSTADTILPPTGLITPSAHLGDGFSSSLLHARGDGQYASRRWVFFGRTHDVAAMLGPVVPLGLAQVEELAERLLADAELDGFESHADPGLLDALMTATARSGDTWQVRPGRGAALQDLGS